MPERGSAHLAASLGEHRNEALLRCDLEWRGVRPDLLAALGVDLDDTSLVDRFMSND